MSTKLVKQSWVELAGSDKKRSIGSKVGAPTPPDEVITVLVRLRRRRALPSDARMTHGEYAAKHAARQDDIDKVRAFAKDFGLAVDAILPVERSVLLKGKTADFSKAFRVELKQHKLANGETYRGRAGMIFIPAALKGIFIGVFGLDDRPVVRSHVRFKPAAARSR